MKIDKNEFFRQATVKICGSLDVETFLLESFRFINEKLSVPADFASIVYISEDYKKLYILAVATKEKAFLHNDSIEISEDKKRYLLNSFEWKDYIITDSLDQHPLAGLWLEKGYSNKTPQLSLSLNLNGKIIGAFNLLSRGKNRFTKYHGEMISLLKEPFAIAVSNAVRFRSLNLLKERLIEKNRDLSEELKENCSNEIIGANMGLKGVITMICQVAHLLSPVLLLGETGTGKEIIANQIHNLSGRGDKPFIKINCGAIPENLIDSELFGHEKGAFTGAVSRKRGKFERADKGTLFLDEVGELTPDVQVRLLRVLQEKEIERVGGTEPVKVDVRIIAATNRDLKRMVDDGKFREDLFFRLNVFPVLIPPLRERKSDIIMLTHHFVQKKTREMGIFEIPVLSQKSQKKLIGYHWPGNVRELENIVERAIILSGGNELEFDEIINEKGKSDENSGIEKDETLFLDSAIKKHILETLKKTNGKIYGNKGAAELLNINPSTLRSKIKKLGLDFRKNL